MKTLSIFFSLTIFLTAFALAMASPATELSLKETTAAQTINLPLILTMPTDTLAALLEDCPICEVDMEQYSGPLTEKEIQALLLALNDEYHAWAVYDQVLSDFGQVRPFINIRRAEAQHINALLPLFQAYNVPVPHNPWIGNVPSFDSVQNACAAGVQAEIMNATLYDQLYASTEREDIIIVYQALQRASNENHLPAFQRCANSSANGTGTGQGNGTGQGQGYGRGMQGNGQGMQQGYGKGTQGAGQGMRDGSCTREH